MLSLHRLSVNELDADKVGQYRAESPSADVA